ncbi:MAG: hypothetical protein MJZ26_01375 [Fibrobacter sp.]|nr:hypothetical protein [Fibrobacter sp.]
MNQPQYIKSLVAALCMACALLMFVGCEKDSDGPISVSSSENEFTGHGFFLGASLDSGRAFHLVSDTLFLELKDIWSFSNCALTSIERKYEKQDSVLLLQPVINIHATEEDCAAPYFRPDTTLKIILGENLISGVSVLKVKNDADSILDSISIRRGSFQRDTFFVYMDSSFADAHNFPLRTKEKKKSKAIPSMIRVLDSLTPRVFFWRTMKSNCTHRIDMCESTVPDTLYPNSWSVNDTNLVPIHYRCADTNLVYCINSKWENDSNSLGSLQERPDTIWHYSTYYTEKIPECASYNSFSYAYYGVGQRVRFIRELMIPDETETFCGPASKPQWMVYNMSGSKMVVDNDSVAILDTLSKIWEEASVAPDTLIVEEK